MCTLIHIVCVYNSTVVGREVGGLCMGFFPIIFLVFSILPILKGVQVMKGLKLNIRNVSSVTMLKHKFVFKKGDMIIYKMCRK